MLSFVALLRSLSRNHLGAEGAAALAPALAANGTLTEVYADLHFMIGTCSELSACTFREQVNLDDVALPIKKLKGTEPVKSLDLSNKGLSFASAIVIASLIGVNGTLTSVDLRGNLLGDNGWGAIFAAICSNKDSKIMSLDSSCETISPAGVQLIAEALSTSVTGALTEVRLAVLPQPRCAPSCTDMWRSLMHR